ncbi:hypothetical protein D3C87_1456820 [compost metagenome]
MNFLNLIYSLGYNENLVDLYVVPQAPLMYQKHNRHILSRLIAQQIDDKKVYVHFDDKVQKVLPLVDSRLVSNHTKLNTH